MFSRLIMRFLLSKQLRYLPQMLLSLFIVEALLACGGGAQELAGTQVRMDFARTAELLAAPFPSEHRVRADGAIDLEAFPNPRDTGLVREAKAIVAGEARGFAVSAAVFFSLSASLGASATGRLPTVQESVTRAAKVFLLDVTPASPTHLQRRPLEVEYVDDAGPFGGANVLSLLPLQGFPLRPRTTYAAVVLRSLGDAAAAPLGVSRALAQLVAGELPSGLSAAAFARYRAALASLAEAGVAPSTLAGLAVFTTDAPVEPFARAKDALLARPLPAPSAFTARESFPTYCVYAATIALPVFQSGTPPYQTEGGDWRFDATGAPLYQRDETANLVVTIPRATMPESGFPTAVFVRTGGGGDRPLVDRGPQAHSGGAAIEAGSGPALHFARAGFAGLSVDGPHGGLRNVTHSDEQLLVFNFTNPRALRDNVRQSALELLLWPPILECLTLDVSGCPGARTASGGTTVRFDTTRLALMGHSMGATIAPLTLAFEPRYRAAVWSGAGGSWLENVRYKRKPLDVRTIAELLLGYSANTLRAHDPVLSLVQWAAEGADPQVFASRLSREPAAGETPRHVLMLQGLVDHYILPRIANALSLATGLDLAGAALDDPAGLAAIDPTLADQQALGPLLPLGQRGAITLPASGNVSAEGGAFTGVVVQHPEDGLEDGHEVAFQRGAARRQYRCFLASFARGTPVVPAAAGDDDGAPCE